MCDTFVVLPSSTADGSLIFGKNSDREPNEAQSLEYHPAARPGGDTLQCTYRSVPQVKETLAVLISRPFWMWGAEMGVNEKGVVIGNEAVFTRMPVSRGTEHLTGMDILRLALERSASAEAAVECMVGLLADYGQGGICGYQDKRMTYHNSFLVADPADAWLFETAGPYWAARRITGHCSISNALSIGEDYDRIHPDASAYASSKWWRKRSGAFHFANAFSDWFFTTFSASRTRQARSAAVIGAEAAFSLPTAFATLRDHGTNSARPDQGFLGSSICAHAANPIARNATQTTGSLVVHMKGGALTVWATGTAAPCTSVFKPIRFEGAVLPDIGPAPGAHYDSETLWWRHESCHRTLLKDWQTRTEGIAAERATLEKELMTRAAAAASGSFNELTTDAFQRAGTLTERWRERAASTPLQHPPGRIYRRYWEKQNRAAGIELPQR
ncbi:MAG: C69 family dipeptidase [Pseudomonadota bacterium]